MSEPKISPYFRLPQPHVQIAPRTAQIWNMRSLCQRYGWPTAARGGGKIGIIELGGTIYDGDADKFAAMNQFPVPQVREVGVRFSAGDADLEVALDIQVAAAAYSIATGLKAQINLYWVDSIEKGITEAAIDGCSVCSISWGADEADWGRIAAFNLENLAKAALAKGMLIFAASGDNNSSDGGPTASNVDLPAASPTIIGCGGTTLFPHNEVVWNNSPGNSFGSGTGGGMSRFFAGRHVPDVAANADPNTGYEVVLQGNSVVVGGTSAVAPLYAGLFAAIVPSAGAFRSLIYAHHECFNDITVGDNGLYHAHPGVDLCTGLGSPRASRLLRLFSGQP